MKSVAIVGGGPTRKQAPWSDQTWEIWTMNEAASKSGNRSEAVFQMHDPGVYQSPMNQTDPNHWEWLKKLHNIKIYMQKIDPEVPDSVEYPLKEIVDSLLKNVLIKGKNDRELIPVDLFTFTGSYAVALAIYLGYDRIRLYGIDMIHTNEYRYQREGFAFWVGVAGGKGIELEIYGAESIFKRPLYGYETYKENRIMKFTINDRLQLLSILPEKADLVTTKILSEFKNSVGFSEEEIKELEIVQDPQLTLDGRPTGNLITRWNEEKDTGKDIEIGEVTRKVVEAAFQAADKSGNFTSTLLKTYEKFTYDNE
jgi:hypothetical protein